MCRKFLNLLGFFLSWFQKHTLYIIWTYYNRTYYVLSYSLNESHVGVLTLTKHVGAFNLKKMFPVSLICIKLYVPYHRRILFLDGEFFDWRSLHCTLTIDVRSIKHFNNMRVQFHYITVRFGYVLKPQATDNNDQLTVGETWQYSQL